MMDFSPQLMTQNLSADFSRRNFVTKISAARMEVQGKDLTGKASGSAKFFGCSKLLSQLRKSSHDLGDGYGRRADDAAKMA
jgi:hypothetical protein